MRNILSITLLAICTQLHAGDGPARDRYRISIDLNKVQKDMLNVEVIVPQVDRDKIEFQMPKMVPGTYAIYDFGRFISGLHAWDSLGNELTIRDVTENRWEISNARKLYKLTYKVEDTFDTEQENKIFEPAGTNIEEGKNFVINTFGFFGYLEGLKDKTFELNVTRPANFYGASSLKRGPVTGNTDQFLADNYFDFHDSPILYCEPDTAHIPVGNCMVTVAIYSPNKMLKANEVRQMVSQTMDAQRQYLGGTLPVDRYSILIYMFSGVSNSGASGALEHSYSTLFSLPEQSAEVLEQTIKDVTAHEFFHIVTPLNIHSEHIADYDFINPQMSQHLWLYEGCTEYAAQHVQVKYGLLTVKQFLTDIKQKMSGASMYNDTLPFTEMSKGALDKYKEQYGNVYQKGALIGMCLDIMLRELSGGNYGLQTLMKDLSKKYGKDNYFLDDKLFDEITAMTYPEIGTFLRTYVSGPKPLPYKEVLNKAGIDYEPERQTSKVTLGRLGISFNPETERLLITSVFNANELAKDLGLKEGDELIAINDDVINIQNAQDVFENFQQLEEGSKIKIVVARKNKEGVFENKTLKAKAIKSESKERHYIAVNPNATDQQLKVRKDWLESRP